MNIAILKEAGQEKSPYEEMMVGIKDSIGRGKIGGLEISEAFASGHFYQEIKGGVENLARELWEAYGQAPDEIRSTIETHTGKIGVTDQKTARVFLQQVVAAEVAPIVVDGVAERFPHTILDDHWGAYACGAKTAMMLLVHFDKVRIENTGEEKYPIQSWDQIIGMLGSRIKYSNQRLNSHFLDACAMVGHYPYEHSPFE